MDINDIKDIDNILLTNPDITVQGLKDIINININRNELIRRLKDYGTNIYIRIGQIIDSNILDIENIEGDNEKLSYIISLAFKEYSEFIQKEKEIELKNNELKDEGNENIG